VKIPAGDACVVLMEHTFWLTGESRFLILLKHDNILHAREEPLCNLFEVQTCISNKTFLSVPYFM
jgi:hypothetical protein